MWNYTCCCCTVALWWLWKNAEVSNGLLKLKTRGQSRSIVDTVWKELSCAARSEESQCCCWWMSFLKAPTKIQEDLTLCISNGTELLLPRRLRRLTHDFLPLNLRHIVAWHYTQAAACLEWLFPPFLWREESYFLCSWKTHDITADRLQPYLWLTYLGECVLAILGI